MNSGFPHTKILLGVSLIALLLITTLSHAQVCTDNYEPNNNYVQATAITPGSVIHALINPSGDVDLFSFTLGGMDHNIRAILSDLPANYDISLYNANGVKLVTAKNKGKENDTIIRNNSLQGTFYLRVYANQGKFNANNCYTMSLETSGTPFKLNVVPQDVITVFDFSLYPDPVTTELSVTVNEDFNALVTVSVYDLTGRMILNKTQNQLAAGETMQLNVSSLINGIYLLKVEAESGSSVKKFSVQR